MRRIVRILTAAAVIAAVVAVVRRLMAGKGDTAPPVAPWESITGDRADQPGPTSPQDVAAEPLATITPLVTDRPDADAVEAGRSIGATGEAGTDTDGSDTDGSDTDGSDTDEAAAEDPRDAGDAGAAAWVDPDEDGSCPDGFPVKLNVDSGIFHVPGGLSYERTRPERCYRDAASAVADGFRQAKR